MCFWLSGGEQEGSYCFLLSCLVKGAAGPILGGCLGHFNEPGVQWVGLCVFDLMERLEEILLYLIVHFYSCLSSPAAHSSCLSQTVGGQAGTTKPHSAFLSPSPACPCKSPGEGELLCKLPALTGDICSSKRASRSSNFCKSAEVCENGSGR